VKLRGWAFVALVIFGGIQIAATVCAWSCAAGHESEEATGHHECAQPPTDGDRFVPTSHCDEHGAQVVSVDVTSPTTASPPLIDFHLRKASLEVRNAASVVVLPSAGLRLPPGRSILRIWSFSL